MGRGQVESCFDLLIGQSIFVVDTLGICFIKEVLLICKLGHFLLNFASHGLSCPTHPIQFGLNVLCGNFEHFLPKNIFRENKTDIT